MSQTLEKCGVSEGALGVVLDNDSKRRFSLTGQPDPSLSSQTLTLRLTLRPSSPTCIVSPPSLPSLL